MTAEELLERYAAGERDFTGVELSETILTDWTDLGAANLSRANLSGANLEAVEMLGVNLENASLRGIKGRATMEGAFFHNTISRDGTITKGLRYA